MEQTECSETSAYKIQTPGNYPEESIQHVSSGFCTFFKINKDWVTKENDFIILCSGEAVCFLSGSD